MVESYQKKNQSRTLVGGILVVFYVFLMSSLAYICGYGYGSNSEDSDCEYGTPHLKKRKKLPAPDLSKVPVVSADVHVDDPEQHSGRMRSFPHVRGNWATFVYVRLPEEEDLIAIVNKLQEAVYTIDESCQKCEDFHISLSRTVVLKYHQITPFTTSLQTNIGDFESFELAFDSVKVYCNEENTRTFIALNVDYFSHKYLLNFTKKIDEILEEYKLPTFYDDQSFHMSILWINGNKKAELINIVDKLKDIVTQEIGKFYTSFTVSRVNCRSGNKQFQYSLK